MYLTSHAKTGLSPRELECRVAAGCLTASLMRHKAKQVMAVCEGRCVLDEIVTMDGTDSECERSGGKVGQSRETDASFFAAVSPNKDDDQTGVQMKRALGFTLKISSFSAKVHLTSRCAMFADPLACYGALTDPG